MNGDYGAPHKRSFLGYNPSDSYRTERRRVQQSARRKGILLKGSLSVGIAACLLITTVLMTSRGESNFISVSAVSFSANDAAGDAEQTGSIFEDSLIDPRLILGTEMPVIYGVDMKEVNPQESGDNTERPEINFDVIPEDIKMEIIKFSTEAQQQYTVNGQGPQILIYHTHTREAYFEADESIYNAGEYQTTDQSHSLVAVGEALKEALETYGFTVIHDTTDHVPPRQGTAYVRSLQTMLAYKQQYPTLRVFIDLHRDAYGNGYPPPEAGQKDFVTVDGQECARVMCVVGTGESYDERPDYESNFKLAQAMTDELEDICDRFTRPVRVKSNRYNQHVSDMCLLIEVGHNANTLQQAENSAKYIALALSRVIDIDGG